MSAERKAAITAVTELRLLAANDCQSIRNSAEWRSLASGINRMADIIMLALREPGKTHGDVEELIEELGHQLGSSLGRDSEIIRRQRGSSNLRHLETVPIHELMREAGECLKKFKIAERLAQVIGAHLPVPDNRYRRTLGDVEMLGVVAFLDRMQIPFTLHHKVPAEGPSTFEVLVDDAHKGQLCSLIDNQ